MQRPRDSSAVLLSSAVSESFPPPPSAFHPCLAPPEGLLTMKPGFFHLRPQPPEPECDLAQVLGHDGASVYPKDYSN